MSDSIDSFAVLGFQVQHEDFVQSRHTEGKPLCQKGHVQPSPNMSFCSLDGKKFEPPIEYFLTEVALRFGAFIHEDPPDPGENAWVWWESVADASNLIHWITESGKDDILICGVRIDKDGEHSPRKEPRYHYLGWDIVDEALEKVQKLWHLLEPTASPLGIYTWTRLS